ncbi:polyprenyl diphosphate synthase [Entomospira culicis]|uniref:Isoprenyl transferase n=1 Tax=Entomospira culicis TaxID=2719989 RepID=A0A968GJ32_9SPIO|nr:polyprenyl diphosphate synthase [Entomospira culicis]NIZ19495.1 di-trans,poly-cis-decaprenylcistransferase [Entomospira culicis]NIZ69600.1 di-trans,poly-cis-decaprenylcistransferase [Entomospira culicis]WDI36711.1 polyprenyl diphosphate synthase [Entomospira culicis]WDI38340.1 polyprenyl diphosphate synthase [Entomospira culicis]
MAVKEFPHHVGIIMDGNGRWAKAKSLPRSKGHVQGLQATKNIVAHVAKSPIPYLSLYTFSTENWTRAQEEVGALMNLIATHLKAQLPFYHEYGIRILHSGDKHRLSKQIIKDLDEVEAKTAHHTQLTLNLLIDYGGRDEIIRAAQRVLAQELALNQESLRQHLDQPSLPDLDCVIRTAGEERLSNFMLWQSAYAEMIYIKTLWPDFTPKEFDLAMTSYQNRHRTFGGE